jgi:hypothetical protein
MNHLHYKRDSLWVDVCFIVSWKLHCMAPTSRRRGNIAVELLKKGLARMSEWSVRVMNQMGVPALQRYTHEVWLLLKVIFLDATTVTQTSFDAARGHESKEY